MWKWIKENFQTFVWAFALSVSVWIAAVSSADPNETRILPSPVPIEVIGQDPALVMSPDFPKVVEVSLRAPSSVWDEIEADPQSVRAILDLSGLSEGEHTTDLQIQVNARPSQIVSISPSFITFMLEPLASRTFNVDLSLSGEPAIGYQVGDALVEPNQVVVAGPRSEVERVARTRLSLNLEGVRENVDESVRVEVLDHEGNLVPGLSASPDTVHLSLLVSQQGGYRDMAVKVVVTGQVATGYRLTNISVYPPVVTVFATDPELVGNLPGVVETQPLDLQNANDDITTRIALNLPTGVSVVGEQTVLIQAGVSPIESSLTVAGEKVELIGLSANLIPQISPPTVDVILSGPLPLLETLTRQDLRVTVDLTNLEAGTYQVTPVVEILISDVVVESILPGTIEVVLFPPGAFQPTPSPTP